MKAIRFGDGQQMPLRGRIMVASPSYTGTVVNECAAAMQLATLHCFTKGVLLDWVFAAGFSLVQLGRCWLNAEFLRRKEFTHLLWLDDDLFFSPDAIMKLFDRHLNAIGGCYSTKHPTKPIFPYQACGPAVDGLQQVIKLPGGFLLLSRSAVEAVAAICEEIEIEHDGNIELCPYVFDLIVKNKKVFGEDFVYCERLVQAGVKVYVETDIQFSHIGRNSWTANLAKTLAEEAEQGIEGAGTPAMWEKFEKMPKALARM